MALSRLVVLALLAVARSDDPLDFNACNMDIVSPGQVKRDMPRFNKMYTVGILINDELTNRSSELIMGTDGDKAYTTVTTGGFQVVQIGDYNRDQLITTSRLFDNSGPITCDVTSLEEAAKGGQWVFGYNASVGFHPHPNDPGWVFKYDFKVEYMGTTTILGIPCNRWEGCSLVPVRGEDRNETVGIKFYWSDPDNWTPVIGGFNQTVPVKAELTRRLEDGRIIYQDLNVFRYFNFAPPKEAYDVPPGVFCLNLGGENITVPTIPDFFSYESEIITRKNAFETLVLYQKHYYDHKLKISRMEYSPKSSDEDTTGVNSPGEVTEIHDFNKGVSYTISKNTGKCVPGPIPEGEEDVDGQMQVRMKNPMNFLKIRDVNLTYYEGRTEREIPAALFMGEEMLGKSDVIYEFYFSKAETQGEGKWEILTPIKFSVYPEGDPNSLFSVHTNIFNFDADEPDILQYDITACTDPAERRSLLFQLRGRYDIVPLKSILEFKYQILTELVSAMDVSPLRIHDIQLDVMDDMTNVQFTLLKKQDVKGNTAGASVPESTSEDAVFKLRKTMNSGKLIIGVPNSPILDMNAIEESLKELNGIGCKPGGNFTTTFSNSATMPRLDKVYDVGLLVSNRKNKSSYELSLGVVGDKAYVKRTWGGIELTLIGDYSRKQLIEMTGLVGDERPRVCLTKSLEDAANAGQWIFGYNKTGGSGYPHPDDPGWVFQFNDFQEKYTGTEEIMGISCNRWEACAEVHFRSGRNETVGVKFYWSNPEKWTPAAGVSRTVPVKTVVTRDVDGNEVVDEYIFLHYSPLGPSTEALEIPAGVYCVGLNSATRVPTVPGYFSYDSEIITKSGLERVIFYQKHYYDDILNFTRMDFSHLLGEAPLPFKSNKTNIAGQFTQIHDFNAGLSYLIDRTNDLCAVEVITSWDDDDDVQTVTQSKIRMRNPMSFLKLQDINYTYYEMRKERSIEASLFMGLRKEKEVEMVYEYWFSGPFDIIEDDGTWTTNKPIKFSTYPLVDPDGNKAVHTNIFNFDVNEPDILDYDITSCTPAVERRTLQFQLGGRYSVLRMPDLTKFKHNILVVLCGVMEVSPLRIHDIQLEEVNHNTVIRFTLLKRQQTCVGNEDYFESPTPRAVENLRHVIDYSALKVPTPDKEGVLFLRAVKGSLLVLESPLAVTCIDFLMNKPTGNESSPMPRFPGAYSAALLITDPQTKTSSEFLFGTDGLKAYSQTVVNGTKITLIGDYERGQLIEMGGSVHDKRPILCTTKSLEVAAKEGQWIFGYNTTGENGRPHPDDPGWVFRFEQFNESYVGKDTIMGIPCNKWMACQEVTLRNNITTLVEAEFYWSDPDKWTPATGLRPDGNMSTVPVKVVVARNGAFQKIVQEYNFFSYSDEAPPEEMLLIPQGVYCAGLTNNDVPVPTLPNYFSYNSETVVKTSAFTTEVFYQKRFYDNVAKLTRIEYSEPTGNEETTFLHEMSRISDFNAGLEYTIDKNQGTCHVKAITKEEGIQAVPNSKIRMRDPMAYLGLKEANYTYYEGRTERGFPASVFMGLVVEKDVDTVYEYWFSKPFVNIEVSEMWTNKKPIKVAIYPLLDPDSISLSMQVNIFDFDNDEPEILDYDISACTNWDLRRHLQFKLRGRYDIFLIKSVTKFKHQILVSLLNAMHVSPLRISSIELDVNDKATDVYFTLLADHKTKGATVDGYEELPSDAAIESLRNVINANRFGVAVPDEAVSNMRAITESLRVLDDIPCNPDMKKGTIEKPMPSLAKTYTTAVLVNVPSTNSSYELIFGTDGDKAYVNRLEDGIAVIMIGDYSRKQVIVMTQKLNDKRPRVCKAFSLEEATKDGNWIFGYNKTEVNGRPHPYDPGWVFHFNDFKEHYIGIEDVMGIPCNRWDGCRKVMFRNDTEELVGVKFYWSDPDSYTPASGNDPTGKPMSIPVRVEVSRRVDDQNFIEEYNFFGYSDFPPPQERFEIPDGVYCVGLDNENVKVPNIPDYFSYESEMIIKKDMEELVFYQKHYFDDELNLSRMEYSPLLNSKTPTGDKSNNTVGEQVQIHDFDSGISYLIDRDAETCGIGPINPMGEDVEKVSQSKIRMANPMKFLKLKDVNYTYYQSKKLRDIPASLYRGSKDGDVYEYWFSSPLAETEGEGMWTTKKPLKFSIYPVWDPDVALLSVHINMFNFDIDEPDILSYDISACTPPEEQIYLTVQLDEDYTNLEIPNILKFKHDILVSLVKIMMVSPLRIHNIELDAHNKTTTIIFTLLKKQTLNGNTFYKAQDELSSEEAVKLLKTAVDENKFIVAVPDGDLNIVKAVNGTVETIEERPTTICPPPEERTTTICPPPEERTTTSCPPPEECPTTICPPPEERPTTNCPPPEERPTTNCTYREVRSSPSSSGYSGGALAGMALGMLLLGGLLGGAAIFLLKRKYSNFPSAVTDHKGFINEEGGSAVEMTESTS